MIKSTFKIGKLEQALQHDPSVSYWLKEQLEKTKERDPIDALNDAELLLKVLKERSELLIVEPAK